MWVWSLEPSSLRFSLTQFVYALTRCSCSDLDWQVPLCCHLCAAGCLLSLLLLRLLQLQFSHFCTIIVICLVEAPQMATSTRSKQLNGKGRSILYCTLCGYVTINTRMISKQNNLCLLRGLVTPTRIKFKLQYPEAKEHHIAVGCRLQVWLTSVEKCEK